MCLNSLTYAARLRREGRHYSSMIRRPGRVEATSLLDPGPGLSLVHPCVLWLQSPHAISVT